MKEQIDELTGVIKDINDNCPDFFEEQARMFWNMKVALSDEGFSDEEAMKLLVANGSPLSANQ